MSLPMSRNRVGGCMGFGGACIIGTRARGD